MLPMVAVDVVVLAWLIADRDDDDGENVSTAVIAWKSEIGRCGAPLSHEWDVYHRRPCTGPAPDLSNIQPSRLLLGTVFDGSIKMVNNPQSR